MPFGSDPVVSAPSPAGAGGGFGKDPLANAPASAAAAQPQHGALYNALFKEGAGGTALASADEGVFPALRDYGLAGLDDLLMGHGAAVLPTSLGSQIAQAHSNLGPMSPIVAGAIYGLGPGKLLGAEGATAALAGRPIAQGAAEGALAGGISGFDPNAPVSSTLTGAAEGGALGGTAGGIGKGVAALTGKPGSIDPQTAVDVTKELRDQKYAPLKYMSFDPNDVLGAHSSATLTPGMAADVSPGMTSMLKRQQQAITGGGNTANDIADYVTNLRSAGGAPGASNGDRILAGQTASNLEGLLQTGQPISNHAPGEAWQTLQDARMAHQQYAMAQNLQDWQGRVKAGAGIGMKPLTEAENYYQNQPEQYSALEQLYQQGQPGMSKLTQGLGHIGSVVAGFGGEAVGGFPAAIGAELLWLLAGKPAVYKAMKGYDKRQLLKGLQQAYPTLTGQQPVGAQPGVQVGGAIKNLMLGSAY